MNDPQPSSPTFQFQWRWVVAGILANIVGLFFVPAYAPERHPVMTWASLVIFPFNAMFPSSFICWFAPLPFYGLLLAIFPRRRLLAYTIAILHTLAAAMATAKHFHL